MSRCQFRKIDAHSFPIPIEVILMQGGIKMEDAVFQKLNMKEENEQKETFSMNVDNGDSFVEKFLRVKEYEELLRENNYSLSMEKQQGDFFGFACVHN